MSDPTLFDYSMIKGTVDAILFQNNDNFYTVIKVETIETNESFGNSTNSCRVLSKYCGRRCIHF